MMLGRARSGPTPPVSSSKDLIILPVPARCSFLPLVLSEREPELDWEFDELSLSLSLPDSEDDSEPLSDSDEDSDLLPDSDLDSLSDSDPDSDPERLPDSLADSEPDPELDSLPLRELEPDPLELDTSTSVRFVASLPVSLEFSVSVSDPEFVMVVCLS